MLNSNCLQAYSNTSKLPSRTNLDRASLQLTANCKVKVFGSFFLLFYYLEIICIFVETHDANHFEREIIFDPVPGEVLFIDSRHCFAWAGWENSCWLGHNSKGWSFIIYLISNKTPPEQGWPMKHGNQWMWSCHTGANQLLKPTTKPSHHLHNLLTICYLKDRYNFNFPCLSQVLSYLSCLLWNWRQTNWVLQL